MEYDWIFDGLTGMLYLASAGFVVEIIRQKREINRIVMEGEDRLRDFERDISERFGGDSAEDLMVRHLANQYYGFNYGLENQSEELRKKIAEGLGVSQQRYDELRSHVEDMAFPK